MNKFDVCINTNVQVEAVVMWDRPLSSITLYVVTVIRVPIGDYNYIVQEVESELCYSTHQERLEAIEHCKRDVARQLKCLGVELPDDHKVKIKTDPPTTSISTTWKKLGQ